MTCVNETFPSDSDDDETDAKQDIATTEAKPIITVDEKKRPAYFADISQPWRKRILIVDPIITDLQADEDKDQSNMALVRTILARLKTFSIPKPPGICIEDLPNRGRAIGSIPVR